MPIGDFIKTQGISFLVARNKENVSTEKGLPNYDKMRGENTINFLPTACIKEGDALTSPDGKTVYVSEISTEYFNGVANYLTVYYQKTPNPEPPAPQSQTIFNIGTVTNSVIGNNNSVSVSIQEMKERAERDGGDDKEALQEIISILEKILAGQEMPKPGLLSKFGACMERNSWITGAIASALINWLV
jgi:hypothetical protein